MARVRVTFEIDVFDFPARTPADWDWSLLLEDDGVDTPDWSTLRVEELARS